MQKNILVSAVVVILALAVGSYHFVNYKAAKLISEQIQVINESYAAMAAEGLMPGVALGYQRIKANYWRNDYNIEDLVVNVAGVGVLLEIDRIQIKGFKPGTLAEQGEVSIAGVQLAQGIQILLPSALAELTKELKISTYYQFDYQPATEQLVLKQQLYLGEQFKLDYAITLQQMQPLWQFASELTAMDAASQQHYSQTEIYRATLNEAFAKAKLKQGRISISNNGFLQALQHALEQTAQTEALAGLKLQLEHFLNTNTALPETVLNALQIFVAEPRFLEFSFDITEPPSMQQLQDEAFMADLASLEQIIRYTNLQLTVNP